MADPKDTQSDNVTSSGECSTDDQFEQEVRRLVNPKDTKEDQDASEDYSSEYTSEEDSSEDDASTDWESIDPQTEPMVSLPDEEEEVVKGLVEKASPKDTEDDDSVSSTDDGNQDHHVDPIVLLPAQEGVKELEEKASPKDTEDDKSSKDKANHDLHFEPVVFLPEQEVKTLEEDEDELFKMRAKLYRFASENDPPEWKERGTGDVKLMKHKEKGTIRLLMRRERTLKVCANHYVCSMMELKPNVGNDRAWVWSTLADFTEGRPKPELLAIRFINAAKAQEFKVKFDECKEEVRKSREEKRDDAESVNKVEDKLRELSVKEYKPSDGNIEENKFDKCQKEVKNSEEDTGDDKENNANKASVTEDKASDRKHEEDNKTKFECKEKVRKSQGGEMGDKVHNSMNTVAERVKALSVKASDGKTEGKKPGKTPILYR